LTCTLQPAILFNFDRTGCEVIAQDILNRLVIAEEKWRGSSLEWKKELKKFEEWQANSKERQRAAERAKKAKKRSDDIEDQIEPRESSFDPNDPSPQFSFAGDRSGYTKSDMAEDIKTLSRWKTPEWAISALRRGIAVHHAGMNKAYRSIVERLVFLNSYTVSFTLIVSQSVPSQVYTSDNCYRFDS
jgi:ATP-dependent RNA helicase DDX60